jgi:hypothetical protein
MAFTLPWQGTTFSDQHVTFLSQKLRSETNNDIIVSSRALRICRI